MSVAIFGIPGSLAPTAGQGLAWDGRKYEPSTAVGSVGNLTGATNTQVQVGGVTGNLTGSPGLTFDGSTLAIAGAVTATTFGIEGTFTPVIAGSSTAGTQTYSVQVGTYTRIGNRVFFQLTVAITALDGAAAGGCRITGLPIAANATANNRASASIGLLANVSQTAAKIAFTAHIDAGASEIRLREVASGASTADLPVTNLGATAQLSISGNYQA